MFNKFVQFLIPHTQGAKCGNLSSFVKGRRSVTVAVGCCVACGKLLAEDKSGGGYQEAIHAKVLIRNGEKALWKQMCLIVHEKGGCSLNRDCVRRMHSKGMTILRRRFVGVEVSEELKDVEPPRQAPQPQLRLIGGPIEKPRRLRGRTVLSFT